MVWLGILRVLFRLFASRVVIFVFPNREVHLDEEATEDAALVRVMREEEEQAVAGNGKGTKEPW